MVQNTTSEFVQPAVTAGPRVHMGGHRPRARLGRDSGAMISDRSLTDTEVGSDVLSGITLKDEVQYLMLAITQTPDPDCRQLEKLPYTRDLLR